MAFKKVILAIFIVLFSSKHIYSQSTLTVCQNCSFKSINEAINKAKAHDTIYIKQGVYKENNILIKKPMVIRGENDTTIDIEKKGYGFIIKSDSVHLYNVHVTNVGQSYTKDFAAIYISKSNHFSVKKVTLDKVFFGILIEKSHHGFIENNTVSSNALNEAAAGNGIHMWYCSNITVKQNELHHLRDGIYFEFVTHSTVVNNYSHDNIRYGLHFMFSNHDEYHYNTFTKNGAGVAVMFSKFIKMTHNTFLENWGAASYGLLLKEIYDAEIINNRIEQNTTGINVEGSTRVHYSRNNFVRNGWAVKISGACYTNIFKENNFLNNSFDVSYNSNLNDNSFDNNYWSDYSGYDLDKNGLGDVPYRPVKLFSYVVNKTPETIVLLRSLFVDIINFSEKVSPIFTPDDLMDVHPKMKKIQ